MTISLPPKGNAEKVLGSYFSPLRASAQATPNMTVKVTEGSFWLADNTHQEYIGGTTPEIFAPSLPSTAKWVVVTVTKNGVLNNVDGIPASSPVLPDPSEYFDELPLAAIFLTDTTTAITNEIVYDIRPLWSVPVDAISQTQLNDFATIVYVNNQLASKADTTGTPEATFILNVGGSTINYSGITVDRALLPDVGIRFNETALGGSPPVVTPIWEFTNDGSVWQPLGLTSALYYTKVEADATFTPITHLTDNILHITADQNIFLDALNLTGSPVALSATDVNQLMGIAGNVQTLLDAKLDDVAGVANNIAILDGTGELSDSGWTLNDAGGSPYTTTDLWSANKIASFTVATLFTKADKIIPATTNDIAGLDATGNLVDTGWRLDDAGTTINDLWSGSKLTTEFAGKVDDVVGTQFNIVYIGAAGDLVDAGIAYTDLVTTTHTHLKADITDFVEADYVHRTGNESIAGLKTFSEDVIITGDLTVGTGGSTAALNAAALTVFDKNITLNAGTLGPTSASDGAGLTVDRDTTGSPPAATPASIVWDDATTRWKSGLEGTEDTIALEGVTVAQPFYELVSGLGASPPAANYNLGFGVPVPVGTTTGIQVFVNGIKQVEGAGKAYQVSYAIATQTVVTFEAGSEPVTGADVEFYGFGYIA